MGALLWAGLAHAQFELDLSEPKVPEPLRPVLLVLGAQAGDQDEVSLARAHLLEAELVKQATTSEQFKTVIEPAYAAQELGARAAEVKACATFSCMESLTRAARGQRAIRASVTRSGVGSVVSIIGFDPGLSELVVSTQDSGEKPERSFAGVGGRSQGQKDREFVRKMVPFIIEVLGKLATGNGIIVVDNPETGADVSIDGVPIGQGGIEATVGRGPHTVRVTEAGFLPFEQQVAVDAEKTVTVKTLLVAKPIEAPKVVKAPVPTGPPIYQRPGAYVALAGAIAVAVGLGFGAAAKSTERAAVDANGDGIIDVTRAQLKGAQGQATIANVLVGVGAAALAGGVVWVIVTPTVAVAPKTTIEPNETTSVGATLVVGGSF
jgi:hypothetical protein